MLERVWEKKNPTLFLGMKIARPNMEISVEVP